MKYALRQNSSTRQGIGQSCIFCRIINGDDPAQLVYEDDHTIAFLDIRPISLGHTLVVTKNHYQNLIELPETEVSPLFNAVKKVAVKVKSGMNADGLNIGLNDGEAARQIIFHLHVHVIPRHLGDELQFERRLELLQDELNVISQRIIKA